MDKISVIVPVYNVEKYLDKCIDSIVNQTYKNLEIILVDDGSPDNCPQMCDAWAEKDSRIKVIHKSNGGLSSARNAGLDVSTGQYIVFVDSDDYISSLYCEKLYKALIDNSADLSICGVKKIYPDSKDGEVSNIQDENLTQDEFFDKMEGFCGWCWVVAWNKLYSRKLFSEIRYPEGKLYEDDWIIHDIIYNCKKISTVSEALYYYVQRENSIISGKYSIENLDSSRFYLIRCLCFIKNNEPSSRVEFCLKMAIKSLYCAYDNLGNSTSKRHYLRDYIKLYRFVWKKAKKYNFSINKKFYFSLNCFFSRIIYWLKRIYIKVR